LHQKAPPSPLDEPMTLGNCASFANDCNWIQGAPSPGNGNAVTTLPANAITYGRYGQILPASADDVDAVLRYLEEKLLAQLNPDQLENGADLDILQKDIVSGEYRPVSMLEAIAAALVPSAGDIIIGNASNNGFDTVPFLQALSEALDLSAGQIIIADSTGQPVGVSLNPGGLMTTDASGVPVSITVPPGSIAYKAADGTWTVLPLTPSAALMTGANGAPASLAVPEWQFATIDSSGNPITVKLNATVVSAQNAAPNLSNPAGTPGFVGQFNLAGAVLQENPLGATFVGSVFTAPSKGYYVFSTEGLVVPVGQGTDSGNATTFTVQSALLTSSGSRYLTYKNTFIPANTAIANLYLFGVDISGSTTPIELNAGQTVQFRVAVLGSDPPVTQGYEYSLSSHAMSATLIARS
jgi:hypothetical protein